MSDTGKADNANALDDQIGSLHFYAKRSQRYHEHRHEFFSAWLKRILFLNLILGSGAVSTYLYDSSAWNWILLLSPVIAAATSAWIVSFRVIDQADIHSSLYQAWNDFEQSLKALSEPKESDLTRLNKRKLELEKREPPVYHAVNRMCRNEVIRSLGLEADREKMEWRHWSFKDVYRFKRMMDNAC